MLNNDETLHIDRHQQIAPNPVPQIVYLNMNPQTISERFVQYYQNLGFDHLPSTSLLRPSIPMTFVMSAGLAQVETAIDQLGSQSPQNDYVLVQNCFRHFDVERIGRSSLHLSLFEMPGAFSFGHNDRKTTVERNKYNY